LGRKGKTARLKPKPAPKFWPIHRKENPWVLKPSSGPHSLHGCLPVTLVLRDMLAVAETRREAQIELYQRKVLVDGKTRKDDFPVGLMDIISMPTADKYYQVLPSHKGLFVSPISKDEANFKLCRIDDKTTVSGGVQLNMHDGSNLFVKVVDPKNPVEDVYDSFDVLKLNLQTKEIVGCMKFKVGNTVVITGGKNIGVKGKIVEIEKTEAKKRKNALVIVEDEKGARFQTILDFVFTLGESQPSTSSVEAAAVV
jgi:small subunit ribosomal protein S4e